jgi:hypothetical protein
VAALPRGAPSQLLRRRCRSARWDTQRWRVVGAPPGRAFDPSLTHRPAAAAAGAPPAHQIEGGDSDSSSSTAGASTDGSGAEPWASAVSNTTAAAAAALTSRSLIEAAAGGPPRLPRGALTIALLLAASGCGLVPAFHLHDTCEDALAAAAAAGAAAAAALGAGPRCARLPGPGRRGLWAVLLAAGLTMLAAALLVRLTPQPGVWWGVAALVLSVPLQAAAHAAACVACRQRLVAAPLQQQQQQQQQHQHPRVSLPRRLRRCTDLVIGGGRLALIAALALDPSIPQVDRALLLAGGSVWLLAALGSLRGAWALGNRRRQWQDVGGRPQPDVGSSKQPPPPGRQQGPLAPAFS